MLKNKKLKKQTNKNLVAKLTLKILKRKNYELFLN